MGNSASRKKKEAENVNENEPPKAKPSREKPPNTPSYYTQLCDAEYAKELHVC